MKRREFIAGLGSAAARPLVAHAQQSAVPVVGYLTSRSSESDASMLVALRRGLNETGFVEGQNLVIEYRFADAQYGRLPALVAELVLGRVAVIVFGGARGTIDDPVWRQLRTSNIPVVFNLGIDPVPAGLARSLNRPGGNFTGIYSLVGELAAKNLGLLREIVPNAKTIAVIADASGLDAVAVKDLEKAAAALGLRAIIIAARTESQIDAAFASLDQQRPDALVVPTNPIFLTWAKQIAALAARHDVPAIYGRRDYAAAGGLMSYGYDVADGYRQMGIYAGRILKGEKAGDLPIFRPTKFELVINLKTAKALGLTIPETPLATADEVIQ
jgi:putative tryptophan/tyrosine transport system substrate-binding protein